MIWPRVLLAILLLAGPIWAGGFSRSLWSLASLTPVFAVAYLDGRQRAVREQFFASRSAEKLKALAGALISQTILVALLFFVAAGVAAALGALEPRRPFAMLDAAVAAGLAALSLLGGALIRRLDGGRDPVDRALEQWDEDLAEVAEEIDDRVEALKSDLAILQARPQPPPGPDLYEDPHAGDYDDEEEWPRGAAVWRAEAKAIAETEKRVPFDVSESLAHRIGAFGEPAEAIALLRAFCQGRLGEGEPAYAEEAAGRLRRIGFAGLVEVSGHSSGWNAVAAAGLEALMAEAARHDPDIEVRRSALELAARAQMRAGALVAAAEAVLVEISEEEAARYSLSERADLRRKAQYYLNGVRSSR